MRMYTSNQYSDVRGPLRECCSIRSGASGLPYYCAPLVCISVVIELLAVWRHNKPKTKKTRFNWINILKTVFINLRLPWAHAQYLSVCLFTWVSVVCVYFLLVRLPSFSPSGYLSPWNKKTEQWHVCVRTWILNRDLTTITITYINNPHT